MPAAKAAVVRRDLLRQARLAGIELVVPQGHPRRTLAAMRLLVAAPPQALHPLTETLFRAVFVDGVDVADRAVLDPIARAHGVDPALIDAPATKALLRRVTDEAARDGVFGVPTLRVAGESFFGVDRLPLVAEALGVPYDPHPAAPPATAARLPITFFHDVASPFSYLAATQIERVAAEAGVAVVYRPVLVGAIFTAIGTPMVPIATFSKAKAADVHRDLARQARRLGVPFRFPTRFPLRSLTVQRLCLVDPTLTLPLYRAAWADDVDLSDDAVVARVLTDRGLDGSDLLAKAASPALKAALQSTTEAAVALGACGVPSFSVGEALFWGQDRLDQVRRAATGWTPVP